MYTGRDTHHSVCFGVVGFLLRCACVESGSAILFGGGGCPPNTVLSRGTGLGPCGRTACAVSVVVNAPRGGAGGTRLVEPVERFLFSLPPPVLSHLL